MATSSSKGGLPTWALGLGVAVLVLVAGVVVWKAVGPRAVDMRPAKAIQPGQYDFKAEIAKMQVKEKAKAEAEKPMGGF